MAFAKGTSGNPKGRPPKSRALTAILEAAGSTSVAVNDKAISGKRLIARLLWEGATTGRVTFPAKEPDAPPVTVALDSDEWLGLVRFIYQHVDGPPKHVLEHTGEGGGPIEIREVVVERSGSGEAGTVESG